MNGLLHIVGEWNVRPVLCLLEAAGLEYAPASPERERGDAAASLRITAFGWRRGDWDALLCVIERVLQRAKADGWDGVGGSDEVITDAERPDGDEPRSLFPDRTPPVAGPGHGD